MIIRILSILIFGAGLLACSSVNTISVHSGNVPVIEELRSPNNVDSIINPYRAELNSEMLEIIATAASDFNRGRPNGALNNWSTDAILNSQKELLDKSIPSFCLLNWGGLRSPINKGNVVLGDIYKLMPFDNEIVIVEMPFEMLETILTYLKDRNGEPIAGAKIDSGVFSFNQSIEGANSFLVVTSDYLMNGGDNMTFFQSKINVIHTGVLMRDAMIEEAKLQGELIWNDENRISF